MRYDKIILVDHQLLQTAAAKLRSLGTLFLLKYLFDFIMPMYVIWYCQRMFATLDSAPHVMLPGY